LQKSMQVKADTVTGLFRASLFASVRKSTPELAGSHVANENASMFVLYCEPSSSWKPDCGSGPRIIPSVQQVHHFQ